MVRRAIDNGPQRTRELAARRARRATPAARARAAALALAAALATMPSCGRGPAGIAPAQDAVPPEIANLHAFARLYGIVRWFHPSDAAAEVDWDRFAVDGARRVVDAPDARALRARLTELFQPFAPTVHIVEAGKSFPDEPALRPRSTAGTEVVAWQHKGYGDSTAATGYVSKRLHRDRAIKRPGALFASLWQSLDAAPFRGARVRLRGKLRAGLRARGQLWLRVDRGDSSLFFDNMARRPVVSEAWTTAEIVGAVAADATRIVFGVLNPSQGSVWYDDLELSVQSNDGTWAPVEIQDPGFEATDPLTSWHTGTGRSAPARSIDGWTIAFDRDSPASGSTSVRLEPDTDLVTEDLFAPRPARGETVDVELGGGLRARVPIALYSVDGHTIGDAPDTARRARSATQPPRHDGFGAPAGSADVIVFWNVFRHFWPYQDVVSMNWNALLDAATAAAAAERSVDDHLATLQKLSVGLPDGHISIDCPGASEHGYPPFTVNLVESQVIVTHSMDPAIQRGDVVVLVDGRAAAQWLATEGGHVSGSPQWRVVVALQRFAQGARGSRLAVRLRRDASEVDVSVARVDEPVDDKPLHSAIERLEDGTYYVDISRVAMEDIDAVVDRLATAPGVIFDMRGYPRHNHQVLSYLLTRPDTLAGWESIPLIIRPDSASAPAGWEDTSTWNVPRLSVRQPHIGGRVAFLIGPGAISSAETFMALAEHYRLGEIVGSSTAGTNGDVARITLPTGCTAWFTGRRMTRPDGGRHHLIGIQPTIPASRSIAGVRAGRDEVLEKALVYVRTGAK